jgi:flagellar biosynthesis protein FliQ
VPAFFIWLLYHFKVPQLALLKADNAWLREAAKKVWESGVEQPPANIGLLTVHSITDEHLELLVAVVLLDASVEEAADILSGKTLGLAFEEGKAAAEEARAAKKAAAEEPAAPPGRMARLFTRVSEARASVRTFVAAKLLTAATLRFPSRAGAAAAAEAQDRRELLLARLLFWCRTSGEVSLPVVNWDEEVEPEAAPADAAALAAVPEELADTGVLLSSHFTLMRACSTRGKPAASAPADQYGGVHSRDVNALTERAAKEVGFLFAAYHCGCWYWEALELGRKLILTSVLALVQPGSATQVVVGLLISFLMLLLNLRMKPFHEDTLNFVNTIAQLNLFFLLFAALLLKVRVDGSGADSTFFTAIVGGMAIVPIALPISIKLFMSLGHSAHKEMRDVQERADEDF